MKIKNKKPFLMIKIKWSKKCQNKINRNSKPNYDKKRWSQIK
jgi:hypothetical protein